MSVDPLTEQFPWYTPYQFAGNKPIAAIDLDGLEEKVVIRELQENLDGTFKVVNARTILLGQTTSGTKKVYNPLSGEIENIPYARTVVHDFYPDGTYQTFTVDEPIHPLFPKPSAYYDYTSGGNWEKASDDLEYLNELPLYDVNGSRQRELMVLERDFNAPDNAEYAKNFEQVFEASFIWIGGRKIGRELFHREIKPSILDDSYGYQEKVGKNPNINIKKNKIILEGQGPYKGKSLETDLDPDDYFPPTE